VTAGVASRSLGVARAIVPVVAGWFANRRSCRVEVGVVMAGQVGARMVDAAAAAAAGQRAVAERSEEADAMLEGAAAQVDAVDVRPDAGKSLGQGAAEAEAAARIAAAGTGCSEAADPAASVPGSAGDAVPVAGGSMAAVVGVQYSGPDCAAERCLGGGLARSGG
jgi:hypothetical protein